MQIETRKSHVAGPGGGIENRQDQPQTVRVLRLDAGFAPCFEKAPQALVLEAYDHRLATVTCNVSGI